MNGARGRYPKEFYALILSSITIFLASETSRPILPLHITDMGATLIELGIIISIMSFALMGIKIPLGILAERVSARSIIIACGLIQSASQLFYSLTPALIWYYPIRILHAISIAPIVPLAMGKAQEYAPEGKLGETLGTFLTSYGIAITFGPFLCSSLLTQFNYVQIFQIISIIPIIGVLPFFVGIKFTLFEKTEENIAPLTGLFSYITHSKNLIILTVLRLLFALGYGFFATYFIVYAEDTILLAPFLIAFLMGIRGAIDMILRIPVGRLVDRIDTKYFIFAGFCILAFVYQLLAVTHDFFMLVILMVSYGVALGLRVVSEWTMVANESPEGHRSVIAAYLSTMFNVGSGFGAVLGGFLATIMIIPDLFRIASGLMIVGMIITLFINKHEKTSLEITVSKNESQEK